MKPKESVMNNNSKIKNLKRIAILAYADSRKELIEWSYANKNSLKPHIIVSTARTAAVLEGTLNTPVLNLHHGRSGGYHQVKSLIEDDHIDMLILFGNPMKHEKQEPWFVELIKAAVQKDIVVAYNQATIATVLESISAENSDHNHQDPFHQALRNNIYNQIQLS
jgi:methylglyoxal synthase